MSYQPQQIPFPELHIRTMMRLRDVEMILRKRRVFYEVPARSTLIEWCEKGIWDNTQLNGIIYVYEDSFLAWLSNLHKAHAA